MSIFSRKKAQDENDSTNDEDDFNPVEAVKSAVQKQADQVKQVFSKMKMPDLKIPLFPSEDKLRNEVINESFYEPFDVQINLEQVFCYEWNVTLVNTALKKLGIDHTITLEVDDSFDDYCPYRVSKEDQMKIFYDNDHGEYTAFNSIDKRILVYDVVIKYVP